MFAVYVIIFALLNFESLLTLRLLLVVGTDVDNDGAYDARAHLAEGEAEATGGGREETRGGATAVPTEAATTTAGRGEETLRDEGARTAQGEDTRGRRWSRRRVVHRR